MPLVLEDGSIVSGANTYALAATVVSYAADRGYTITTENTTIYIYKFMDYLETLNYKGNKVDPETQELQFPRENIFIDGQELPSDEIPQQLINALCAGCICISLGFDPLSTVKESLKEKSFAVFKKVYQDNSPVTPILRVVDAWLAPLVTGYNSGIHFKVERSYS